MFEVVDMKGTDGPEFVNEYAIYSNAVLGALLWNKGKQKRNGSAATERHGTNTQ